MKYILSAALQFLVLTGVFAQGNITYHLQIINNEGQPVPGLEAKAVETYSLKTIPGTSNGQGEITMELNGGKMWILSVGEIEKCRTLHAIDGKLVEISAQYVYDPDDYHRKLQQKSQRSRDDFSVIETDTKQNTPFQPDSCFLGIQLEHPDGTRLKDIRVSAVSPKDSLVYTTTTNQLGMAYFILPNRTRYDLDVDNAINYTYCDFGDEYAKRTLIVQYAPTVVHEEEENDTIYQHNNWETQASSNRALVLFNVFQENQTCRNEKVYLQQLHSGKVFAGTTDEKGRVWFLLPTSHIYMVSMKYHENIDALNLLDTDQMTRGEMKIQYSPDPRKQFPERFIPTTDRLVTKDFGTFLDKQLEKPEKSPFRLKIASAFKIHKETREALFTLQLASSDTYGTGLRTPMNLTMVLDKSGSMYTAGRYEAMQYSLREIGETLMEEDVLSVVLFDNESYRVFLPGADHKDELDQVAEYYRPGGGTFIYKALYVGAEDVLKNYSKDRANRLMLLTDGYGITPPDTIVEFVKKKAREGVEFSAIGLGNEYNQSLLRLIAEKGNGNFIAVDSADMLPEAFIREIKGTYSYVASDLKVDVFHHDQLVFSQLYGYPVSSSADGQISFYIHRLPRSREQIAFLKFKLDEPTPDIENHPLRMVVSYYDPVENRKVEYSEEIPLVWTEETDTKYLFDQQEKKLYAIATLNQTLKLMSQAYEMGDNKAAKQYLKDGRDQIEDIYPDAKPREVKKLFDDVDWYIELFNRIETNSYII